MAMRYVRAVLIPDEECFHPVDRRFAEEPDVSRELLHNVNLLEDGTVTVLYELTGDADRVHEIVDDSPEILESQLSIGERRVTVYAHIESVSVLTELLALRKRHELIVDMPLEYTTRGGLRLLAIGSVETIQTAMAEVPDPLQLKLEKTGDYLPESERLFDSLTPRQQETLVAALDVGYYQVPRQATHQEVAEELDRSDGTVGEHLRKIEQTVFAAITPR